MKQAYILVHLSRRGSHKVPGYLSGDKRIGCMRLHCVTVAREAKESEDTVGYARGGHNRGDSAPSVPTTEPRWFAFCQVNGGCRLTDGWDTCEKAETAAREVLDIVERMRLRDRP